MIVNFSVSPGKSVGVSVRTSTCMSFGAGLKTMYPEIIRVIIASIAPSIAIIVLPVISRRLPGCNAVLIASSASCSP